jgi:Protein of unknown function (DUF3572).
MARPFIGAAMDPFKPYQPKNRPAAPPRPTRDDARALALQAVAFMAGDETLLSRFVALTGCGVDDFRRRMADDGFLAAVLDFLLSDEPAVVAFADAEGIAPELPLLARTTLDVS